MIAQCPSCSARFRVADDKVPDKGVKVRCTKCATVFKVTRSEAAPAPAPAQEDFGLGFNAPAPPPPALSSARRSQSFDIGESTSPVPLPAAGSYGNLGASHVPAAQPGTAVSLPYGAASPQNSLDLDLSLGPPPPAPAPPARPAMPGGGFRPVPPSTANASLNAIDAALDAAMASSSSGGFDLGLSDDAPPPPPARPPPQRAPPARPPAPLPAAAVDPFASLSLDGGSDNDPFADLGPPPLPPPPAPPATRAPPRPAPKAPPARPAAPPPSDLGASDPFAVEPNFDESPGLELNAPPAFSPAPSPVRTPSAPEPSNPFSGLDSGPGAQAPAPATPAAAAPAVETPPAPAPEEPAAAPPADGPVRGANNEFDFGSDDAAAGPAVADERVQLSGDLAKIQLSRKDGSDRSSPPPVDAATLARSRQRADYWAALFNVVSAFIVGVAAIISVALIRSPRPLTSDDFGFPLVWIALGLDTGAGDHLVRTLRVTTTAYPTRAGADLFVVRGDVENSGDARRGAVTVVVELMHAGTLVGRAESVAGLGAGPEEIFLQDARRNDELQLSLARTATTVDLGANATLPFVAIFPVSAAEAAGCIVRLNVVDGIPAGMEGAFAAGVLPSARKPAPDAVPAEPSPANTSTDAGTAPPDAGEAAPAEGTR